MSMAGDTFIVRFVRFKTCFLYMSDRWTKKLQDLRRLDADCFLKVVHGSSDAMYFSWQQSNFIEPNCIGINATLANNIGVKEGDCVSVILCGQPTPLQSVTVSPITPDDLEMIESSSGIVQSTLLNQVRIVYSGQLLTAWISNTLPVTLKITSLQPDVQFGRLEQMTEMTVGSPENQSRASIQGSSGSNNEDATPSNLSCRKLPINSFPNNTESGDFYSEQIQNLKYSHYSKETKSIFRVHPLNTESSLYGPCDVFLTRSEKLKILLSMNKLSSDAKNILVCKITKLQCPSNAVSEKTTHLKLEEEEGEMKGKGSTVDVKAECASIFVRLRSLNELEEEQTQSKSFQNDCVFISNNLRRTLNLEIGSRVKFTNFQDASLEVQWKFVEILPFHGIYFPDFANSLLKRVQQTSDGLLLSTKMLLTLSSEKGFIDVEVRLLPSSVHFAIVFPEHLHEEQVKLKLEKPYGKQHNIYSAPKKFSFPRNAMEDLHTNHLNSMLRDALSALKTTLGVGEFNSDILQLLFIRCNILITGKRGSGKTSTALTLCYTLQKSPYYVHFSIFKCRPLKGKKVETILKTIQNYIADSVYHQPSILILDDLDSIAGITEEQDQNNPRSLYYNRVGKILSGLLSQVQSNHRVAVIATAPSTSCLSSSIISPRGVHIFNTFIEQPELSKEDRQGILSKLLARKVALRDIRSAVGSETLSDCALKSEGYSCQDLYDLLEKAVFAACKRQGQSQSAPVLQINDVNNALMLSTPMLLRGVSLHKESSYVWDDVGGLAEVKETLKEVLQWPVLYPSLFSNSPLRHQSGLLLYGAPGTGKTMLAGAVANECGLNFISVKGPELLSKYIGASEASVRDIFQKAQSAKPCVLFFDEFDSLAPRRGHDSTGVTDRVVNQLLTQLDGVESLSGVWVLAATSRPDLLDPALLRPGRLDRSVLCPLPEKEDRLAILVSLSRKLTTHCAVNLEHIADSTDGFTGADLQSVLYTAQLNAVEESQSHLGEGSLESNEVVAVIKQKHLDDALKDTRPSLSSQEHYKYIRIYEKFRGNVDVTTINARATLA